MYTKAYARKQLTKLTGRIIGQGIFASSVCACLWMGGMTNSWWLLAIFLTLFRLVSIEYVVEKLLKEHE